MMGMKKVRTSPYHPQADGLVERLNRTLLQMLSTADRASDWDHHLDTVAFAYRTSVQPSIGLSPFQLLYGRQACQPANLEFSLPRRPRFKDAHHYLADVRRAQREAVELAEEFLAAS